MSIVRGQTNRIAYLIAFMLSSGACGDGHITSGTLLNGTLSVASQSPSATFQQGSGVCSTTLTAVGWTDVRPIFAAHCVGCHSTTLTTAAQRNGANSAYNFDTYAAAVSSTQDGAAQADWSQQDNMPPPGNALKLTMTSPQEMCILDEWVRGGNPNVASTTPQTTLNANNQCATGNATIAWKEVEPIFNAHCTGCHASTLSGTARNGAATGINFDTEAAAISAVQGSVAESDWDQPDNMPPPGNKVNATAISDQESCVLDGWVRQLPVAP